LSRPGLRAAALASVLLLLFAGSGAVVAQAADNSLPDSPLDSVRRAREWVDLRLARGGEGQVAARASQLQARSNDLARALARRKSASVVDELVRRATNDADRMVARALDEAARGKLGPARRALAALRARDSQLA